MSVMSRMWHRRADGGCRGGPIAGRLLLAALLLAVLPPLAQADSLCKGYRDRVTSGRIVGGWTASLHNWPGIAAMALKEPGGDRHVYLCGGTAIHPEWVLTAAHCAELLQNDPTRGRYVARAVTLRLGGRLVDVSGWNVEVVLGVDDLANAEPDRRIPVDRVIIHEDYRDPAKTGRDIALLHLSRPWSGPYMRISQSPDSDPQPTGLANVMVAGFGFRTEGQGLDEEFLTRNDELFYAGSRTLQEVGVPLVTTEDCATRYAGARIGPGQVCAGFTQGAKDSCQGDSGGPLVAFDSKGCPFQIGVVSWGRGCARANSYGVYTRLSHFADWIRTHVGDVGAPIGTATASTEGLGATIQGLIVQLENMIPSQAGDLTIAIKNREIASGALSPAKTDPEGRPHLTLGQEIVFEIKAKRAGRLVLVDISAGNVVQQIFPNSYTSSARAGRIAADKPVLVPDEGYGFKGFRVGRPLGWNKVLALVLPEDFPLGALVEKERNAGTIKSVEAPTSYLMNLTNQVKAYIESKKTASMSAAPPAGAAPANAAPATPPMAMAVLDYAIE